MIDRRTLAGRLKGRRVARGLSREQVAVTASVSMATVVNLEQGRKMPRIDTLSAVADALGVSIGELLDGRRLPAAA